VRCDLHAEEGAKRNVVEDDIERIEARRRTRRKCYISQGGERGGGKREEAVQLHYANGVCTSAVGEGRRNIVPRVSGGKRVPRLNVYQ